MEPILTENQVESFLQSMARSFPKCVAGVIADENGFILASLKNNQQLNENMLALQAISNKRIVNLTSYRKIIKPLGNGLKVMLVLEQDNRNLVSYKKLYKILNTRNPFRPA